MMRQTVVVVFRHAASHMPVMVMTIHSLSFVRWCVLGLQVLVNMRDAAWIVRGVLGRWILVFGLALLAARSKLMQLLVGHLRHAFVAFVELLWMVLCDLHGDLLCFTFRWHILYAPLLRKLSILLASP